MNEDAELGRPSYVWRFGQERRFSMVRQYVDLDDKNIIDIACGIGMYMRAFLRITPDAFGTEIDQRRARQSHDIVPHVAVAAAEHLPFRNSCFDVAFLHEMIEHVDDDRQTIHEACRVVRPNGYVVVFAPNRLYPFETHGVYWGDRYIFGNIPLVNYLPDAIRNKLAPHVRAYTVREIKQLFAGLDVDFLVLTQVYPGFDKLTRHHANLGRLLRLLLYRAEQTPLRIFGLSHFVIARVRKRSSR